MMSAEKSSGLPVSGVTRSSSFSEAEGPALPERHRDIVSPSTPLGLYRPPKGRGRLRRRAVGLSVEYQERRKMNFKEVELCVCS